MKPFLAIVALLLLVGVGCATSKPREFAPFDARFETVPGGGAQHLVLINTSGRHLHNFRFAAHVWNEHSRYWLQQRRPFRDYQGSGAELPVAKPIRFRLVGLGVEDSLVEPVTRLEVVGHCDEGKFHQVWTVTEVDHLQPVRP